MSFVSVLWTAFGLFCAYLEQGHSYRTHFVSFFIRGKKKLFLSFFFSLNMDRSVLFRGTFEYEDRKKQE